MMKNITYVYNHSKANLIFFHMGNRSSAFIFKCQKVIAIGKRCGIPDQWHLKGINVY